MVLAADAGSPEAQCDLALWLLAADRAAAARDWLTLSARAGYADAMCHLGGALLTGLGGERDESAGILWLSQAAGRGSPLGRALIAALHGPAGLQARAAGDEMSLARLLDAATREVLLRALRETADA